MLIILCLAVLAVYFPVLRHGFQLYDDDINIVSNPLLTNFSWRHLGRLWVQPYLNLYIPLTYSVWALLGKGSALLAPGSEGPPSPALFHAASLLLHLGSTVLVFGLCQRLLKQGWVAALAALFFALHPVQVETVAWVTGMKDGLSGFLVLLALSHYLRYTEDTLTRWQARRHYVLASIALLAALFAKPTAVVLPLHAAIVGLLLRRRGPRQIATELLPWALLSIPFIVATKLCQPDAQLNFTPPPVWQRPFIAGDAIVFYAGKILMPFGLGPDYGRTPQQVLTHGLPYASGLLPYLGLAWLLAKCRAPLPRTATALWLAAILPVLGFLPFTFQEISTVADRYLYVALLGPALLFGWLLLRLDQRLAWWLGAALLCLLATQSIMQLRSWQDPVLFSRHALEVNPKSRMSLVLLGVAYSQQNQHEQAIAAYRQAVAIDPGYAEAYLNLGAEYAVLDQAEMSIAHYKKAIALKPDSQQAYQSVAELSEKLGNQEEALLYYQKVARWRPQAEIFDKLASLCRELQRPDEAVAYYLQALAHDPARLPAYFALGALLSEMDRKDEAVGYYEQGIAMEPASFEGHNNLGILYHELGRSAEAIDAYRKAIELNPASAEPYNNLGFILHTLGRSQEAIPLFRQAAERRPAPPLPYHNLGLAYAALGQTAEAFTWFTKAIAVDPSYAPAMNALARISLQQKDYGQAIDYAGQAKALGLMDAELDAALQPYRQQ